MAAARPASVQNNQTARSVLPYRLGMRARNASALKDAATARRILLDGLAGDSEVAELVGELAPLHPRNDTLPGEVFLNVAADVLDCCGARQRRTAPLCQAEPLDRRLADEFGLVEEVVVEAGAGVEDFDADEAAIFPVEDDECVDAFGRVGGDAGPAGHERVVGELDVDGVGLPVVGGPHVSIVPCWSRTSWW